MQHNSGKILLKGERELRLPWRRGDVHWRGREATGKGHLASDNALYPYLTDCPEAIKTHAHHLSEMDD